MNVEKMLEKIRLDRPTQVINEVISIKENEYGFYDVLVDMELMFYGTKILHNRYMLSYPLSEYEKLTETEQREWRMKN